MAARKIPRLMPKTIVTHNGTFHCDESLACFLLRQTNEYKGAEIVRTRDPEVIDQAEIVVDVGAVYDPARNRFDHHQRGFEETLSEKYDTKLSSAGLVFKHFGHQVLRNVLEEEDENILSLIYDKVYSGLIREIDAIDNGITQFDGESRYRVVTNLSARVGRLNPAWNQPATDEDRMRQFEKAVEMTGEEFLSIANQYHKSWYPGRSIVEKAVQQRKEVHPSGQIVFLPQYCPWTSHLHKVERELELSDPIFYVVFGDSTGGWRVQAVPVDEGSFESRKALPEPWRGKRDEVLSEETGIPDCIFIHASGFIGGNKTKEGAMELAKKALDF